MGLNSYMDAGALGRCVAITYLRKNRGPRPSLEAPAWATGFAKIHGGRAAHRLLHHGKASVLLALGHCDILQ